MSTKNLSLLECVELAINMEEEGLRFYQLAAGRVDDGGLRDLLLMLKDKEYNHINTFRGLYTDMAARRGETDAGLYLVDPEISAYFRAFVESTVFPVKGAAEEALRKVAGPVDILRLGMQVEKDSILFYQDLLHQKNFPEATEILSRIIGEERRHFQDLHRMWRKLSAGKGPARPDRA